MVAVRDERERTPEYETIFFPSFHLPLGIHLSTLMATLQRLIARSLLSCPKHTQTTTPTSAHALALHARFIHASRPACHPRKPRNAHGGAGLDRLHFGQYSRLAPTSLRLGVIPPDVDSLVPPHVHRPSYALRGEPSEWASEVPINTPESIEGCRQAGQLAKKILVLGGALVKVP